MDDEVAPILHDRFVHPCKSTYYIPLLLSGYTYRYNQHPSRLQVTRTTYLRFSSSVKTLVKEFEVVFMTC